MEEEIVIKEDARIVRTKRDLANALEELLKERSLEDISIKDITDRALISKNTFYNNFNDKNELLVFLFERYESALFKEIKPILDKAFYPTRILSFKKALEIIVHFFCTTSLPFEQMIENDKSHVLYYSLTSFIGDAFSKMEKSYGKFFSKRLNREIAVPFYAGAYASTIYLLYKGHKKLSEKEIYNALLKLSLPAIE